MRQLARIGIVSIISGVALAAIVIFAIDRSTTKVAPPDRGPVPSYWETLRGTLT
jgi:hypothetical protein